MKSNYRKYDIYNMYYEVDYHHVKYSSLFSRHNNQARLALIFLMIECERIRLRGLISASPRPIMGYDQHDTQR